MDTATESAGKEDGADGEEGEGKLPPTEGQRPNFLDAIKGMGVSKLRKREESEAVAQRVQKKEAPKQLSMQDALRERLARRNE